MTIADRVKAILSAMPKTRDSDLELWLVYAYKSGLKLTPEQQEVIKGMPSFETITRVRRKLQENGKYKASAEVARARQDKARAMQVTAPKANADTTARVLVSGGKIDLGNGRIVLPYGK